MIIRDLEEASQVLKAYMPVNQSTDWNFALEQMQEMMAKLGNPQDAVRAIHVAGTSGKTSTCYYAAEMLRLAGKKVGLTVSPHVDGLNDRVQINGQPLPETTFCKLLEEFLDLEAVKTSQPSYFGVMVAFAYWVFAQQELDYMVVEVGLGGRKDATNVITRPDKIAVITDIGLDHTEMLGDTVELIAAEKAEIIKPDNQVFVGDQAETILQVFQGKKPVTIVRALPEAPDLLPKFQQRNWSLAYRAVAYIAERDGFAFNLANAQAAAQVYIPARMETVMYKDKTIIIDGAHNGQKISALCQSISQKYPAKFVGLVSFVQSKDASLEEAMRSLAKVVDRLVITTFTVDQDVPKTAMDPEVIATVARQAGITQVSIVTDPVAAFAQVSSLPDKHLLITGSFYLLNSIRPLIRGLHD